VTRFVEGAQELATVLFGPEPPRGGRTRREALREAGRLIRTLEENGIYHRDLNAKNVLLEWRGEGLQAWLLDLDRCQTGDPGRGSGAAAKMHRRLGRSLEKLARKAGRVLEQGEWRALAEGVEKT
jgi:tRNA A-37 threonylcarbamoyl transferase component Bud32